MINMKDNENKPIQIIVIDYKYNIMNMFLSLIQLQNYKGHASMQRQ